ncbi:hypothetical protein F511_12740 [Dorcoceras hygrometricum]|uniref:Uncharacterized protein n=1 Tax=Dorcoceras hygrometricum TaxID=472368 RepID=A0A2Z7BYK5_9LAMI|nr:hypothetical protein F511_12740 [Dorcoceras hygrometricum]
MEENTRNEWRAVNRRGSGSNNYEQRTTPKRHTNQGGSNANRFDALVEESGNIPGDEQEVADENFAANVQVLEPEDVAEGEQGDVNHGLEEPVLLEAGIAGLEPLIIQPVVKKAAALEPLMLPNCQKTKTISSLESFQVCDDSLGLENAHRDLNLGAADDAPRNTIKVGGIDQMLAAAVDSRDRALVQMGCDMSSGSALKIIEENLETDTGAENSEDDELQGTSKGLFKRSLSAGNLKLKGPVPTHRVVTRSHTRSQGTSPSQSYQ